MKAVLDRLRRAAGLGAAAPVYVVSGLPRSGTSMAMSMLEAGGVPMLTDGAREADADNPRGYYELERVKALREGDDGWVEGARGRAVKVISELLPYLPARCEYRVIFMRRDLDEILASQRRMMERLGTADGRDDERMAELYRRHLRTVERWAADQRHVRMLSVHYADVLRDPAREARRIRDFLGVPLDLERMTSVVDARLYRSR